MSATLGHQVRLDNHHDIEHLRKVLVPTLHPVVDIAQLEGMHCAQQFLVATMD